MHGTPKQKQMLSHIQIQNKMIDVQANYPGHYENNTCRFCGDDNETQEHIFKECKELTELTNQLDTTHLNSIDNMNYFNEAKIIQQVITLLEENIMGKN